MKEKLLKMNARYTDRVTALLDEMSKHDEATLNRPSPTGGWSVLQNMLHLVLAEHFSLKYAQKKLSFGGEYPKTGLAESWRYFKLLVAFSLPLKFKAPPNVGGKPEDLPAQSTLAEVRVKWLAQRAEWTAFLEAMPADLATRTVYRHPKAGKIGWKHLLHFFGFHLERHYRQILANL